MDNVFFILVEQLKLLNDKLHDIKDMYCILSQTATLCNFTRYETYLFHLSLLQKAILFQ